MNYAPKADWLRSMLWLAWPVGAAAWVIWFGSLYKGGWLFDYEDNLVCGDHLAFYSAATLVRAGESGRMYDYDAMGVYQGELIGRPDWGRLNGFRNPPFYALLYLPTAGLPYMASMAIWTAVGVGALAAGLYLVRPSNFGKALLLSLTFYPVFAAISFGQNSLLSLGVFAGVYRWSAARRPFAAGLVAGLLWFKPQLLLGLFAWWALDPRRHARSWVGVGVTGSVLAAVCWTVLPAGSWAFTESLGKIIGYGGDPGWNKQSPRAFWGLLLPPFAPAWLTWTLALAAMLAGLVVFVRLARRTGGPTDVMFPAAIFLTLWVSPHTLIYEWAILIPAAVVLWDRFPDRRPAWVVLFTVAWVALLISTPIAKVQIDYLPEGTPVVQLAVPLMAAVGYLVAREFARPVGRVE